MIMRGGGAHIPGGTAAIKQGSLAVECPACPQPGRNMPHDLNEIPEEDRYVIVYETRQRSHLIMLRWLFALFIAVDANFRLKLKARGIRDPEIGSGWTYFVEQLEYEKHVRKHWDEKDVRSLGSIEIFEI